MRRLASPGALSPPSALSPARRATPTRGGTPTSPLSPNVYTSASLSPCDASGYRAAGILLSTSGYTLLVAETRKERGATSRVLSLLAGKREASDTDTEHTAAREFVEESGGLPLQWEGHFASRLRGVVVAPPPAVEPEAPTTPAADSADAVNAPDAPDAVDELSALLTSTTLTAPPPPPPPAPAPAPAPVVVWVALAKLALFVCQATGPELEALAGLPAPATDEQRSVWVPTSALLSAREGTGVSCYLAPCAVDPPHATLPVGLFLGQVLRLPDVKRVLLNGAVAPHSPKRPPLPVRASPGVVAAPPTPTPPPTPSTPPADTPPRPRLTVVKRAPAPPVETPPPSPGAVEERRE